HRGGDQPGTRQGGPGRGRPAATLSQHARLHLPAEEREEFGRRRAAVGIGLGLAARALSQPQHQRRRLARTVPRRALPARGIDRDELNQVVYIGLAKPSNNTIMERSSLFKPEYASKWAQYDPKLANKLLDEVGLTKRDAQGIRLLADGRPATIVVENQSEETE